jgi:hypothetical protein
MFPSAMCVYHNSNRCARIRLLMRRIASIAVLLVLLTATLVPLMQASASTLPACCRAGGKHHCEMSTETSGLEGFKSVPPACPYRIHAAVTSPLVALATRRHHTAAFVLASKAAKAIELTLCANLSDDTHKRGPPAA